MCWRGRTTWRSLCAAWYALSQGMHCLEHPVNSHHNLKYPLLSDLLALFLFTKGAGLGVTCDERLKCKIHSQTTPPLFVTDFMSLGFEECNCVKGAGIWCPQTLAKKDAPHHYLARSHSNQHTVVSGWIWILQNGSIGCATQLWRRKQCVASPHIFVWTQETMSGGMGRVRDSAPHSPGLFPHLVTGHLRCFSHR